VNRSLRRAYLRQRNRRPRGIPANRRNVVTFPPRFEENRMTIAELVYEQVKALPEQLAREVLVLSAISANGRTMPAGAI
jgi:hypothetical protein